MEGSRYSTIDSRQQLEAKAKEYKGGDLLEGFSVAKLRSLLPSGEICPDSREQMLEGAFRIEMRASLPPADIIAGFLLEEHTLQIQRVVAGMSLSDLQIPEQCYRNQHICAQVGGTGGISCRYRASFSDQHHVKIDAMWLFTVGLYSAAESRDSN